MPIRHFLIPAAALGCIAPASAQEQDAKLWLTGVAIVPLEKRLSLDIESTVRFSDADGGLYETIQSLWVTRTLDSGARLQIGYQRNDSARRDPGTIENRLRQQVAVDLAKIAGGTLTGQLRFEQRFRNDGDDVHFRLRPQIAYARPFTPGGPTSWALRHESFFGGKADWNNQSGLFRIRNHASIRHKLNGALQVEAGYLNAVEFGRNGARDAMDHVAVVALTYAP
ncbi:DUF2490 domain-containing protein [Sphingomonas japonica]|uniref:DUF2490 domain-containing protein n=1 Tax=Sphingomonas japonica TaxID=511662 RepID=A0ABX0U4E1_9SPHN|nr:DUF2490 domain-containing protein [Sphingomonas japonica]NIJ23657.1 hypothetical protein [Sphingomonas japonica]